MANIHDVNESLQVQPSVRNLPTLIALSQGENGRSLQFRMVGATIPSGSSASLSGTKPDGVVYSKAGTVDGNTVIFQEDVQLTAVAGAWDAKIHIVNSGNSVATALIRFIIDPDPVAAGAVPSDTQLEGIVAECKLYAEAARSNAYGSPLTASAAADMIDTSKVYVYTGSETGYAAGHWYYYNGTAWADGGVYNSIAIQTDTTLTLPDHAADAKATGDKISDIKEELTQKALTISNGKNLLNPADKIANVRLYAISTVGGNIMTTSQNLMNVIKIPVAVGETYTISHVSQYVIGDKDNKAVIVSQIVGNYAEYTVTAPENSAFLWVQVSDAQLSAVAQVEKGNKRTFYEPYTKYSNVQMDGKDMVMVSDIPCFVPNMETPTIVNPSMTKNEFITAFNTALDTYASFNEAHIHSFLKIPALARGEEDKLSWDDIFFAINADFRKEVATSQMSMETICQRINEAFTEKIYRFSDARLSDGNRKYSLECGFQADEPSAIVVGGRLYIYAHLKRIYTEDGITWSQPETIVLSDSGYIMHINVNFIDGVYYMIGTDKNSAGDLILYTSTDGVNFTYQGIMFKYQFEFSSGKSTANYGNTYLIKEYGSGKFYLYIESQADASWEINLALFDDFTTQNQDGTIGSRTIVDNNPIISRPLCEYRRETTAGTAGAVSAGNPDFAKLSDNKPLKHNGEYYMYLHSTWNQYSSLLRARSSDLVHWECDGVLFDNRDIPSAGEMRPGNADHCVIEYKGRTYLFYSYDINDQAHLSYIKYTVDDRPFHVILGLRP